MTTKHFRTRIALCIAAFAAVHTKTSPAACHPNNVAQGKQEIKLIVPFAVPLGVPVAPLAPYFYSSQAAQGARDEERGARIRAEENRSNINKAADSILPSIPAPRASLLATHCAACHGGPSPKANLSFALVDKLSIDNRLNAIRAVVSGRMPLGEKLSPDEVHALVKELSQTNRSVAEAQR
jgi:mono/diheme cytochrome c family protein